MREGLFIGAALLSFGYGVALLLVNPTRAINRLFFAVTVTTCVWFFCITMAITTGRTVSGHHTDAALLFWLRMCFAVPALIVGQIAFMSTVLNAEISNFRQLLRRARGWILISLFLVALAFSDSFIPASSTPMQRERGPAYLVYVFTISTITVWAIIHALRHMRQASGVHKLEAQFFVLNLAAATLLILASNLFAIAFPKHDWLRSVGPLSVCLWQGITIWSVCYHRVFDAQHVVFSVGQRLLLLGILGASAVGLVSFLDDMIGTWPSLVLASVSACGLALVSDRPMRKWFGLDPEHRITGPRQAVIELAKQVPGEEKLRQQFESLLREWCLTERAALLSLRSGGYANGDIQLRSDWEGLRALGRDGWITPESLQRRREIPGATACRDTLEQLGLGAILAVPQGSPAPSLLIALGQRTSLRPYTYPDIRLLLELTELMDNILTHSRVAARTAQIEKMESAAMMSRGLAHDLNNLATPVASFLLHMEPRVQAGTPEAEVLHDAKHAVRVMQDYIRESLFFTRRLTPDFRTAAARELMESVLTLTQARAAARGVTVKVTATPDIPFVADSTLIRRLLQNLVFNGIDATPSGGVVTLSAAVDTEFVRFSVSDEGAGIPPAIMDRIFEPYFTTKDTGDDIRGLGLGLAICRKICDLHGGDIKVRPAPGRGSVFVVVLPLDPRPAAPRDATTFANLDPVKRPVPAVQIPSVRPTLS